MISILFIHADTKLAQIYGAHLRAEFSFDSAHDGLSGIRKIRQLKPNIVVSDYRLPILSGASVLKFVRRHPKFHHLPFLFLTDHPDPTEGLSLGANDWLAREATHPKLLAEKIYHHLKHNPYAL